MVTFNLYKKTEVKHLLVDGVVLTNYAISRKAELFKKDEKLNVWSPADVLTPKGSSKPSVVQLNGQRKSLAVILAESFSIATAEATAIVDGRYGTYYPDTYHKEEIKMLVKVNDENA